MPHTEELAICTFRVVFVGFSSREGKVWHAHADNKCIYKFHVIKPHETLVDMGEYY